MIKPATRQAAAILLAVGALNACSFTPKYVRPDAPVAASYPREANTNAATSARHAADIDWHEFFPDPRLQALIAAALENNRDLRNAALRIEEARALYNLQTVDLYPSTSVGVTGTRSRVPASLSPTGTSIVTSGYQVGLNLLSFELDFFGRVRSLNDAALTQYLSTEEAHRAAQISLIGEVANAYLAERAFAEQQELAQKALDTRQAGYKLASQRVEVGASSAFDLRLNETLVLSARVALATLARQRAQAMNALTLLVGKPLNDLPAPQSLSAQNIVSDLPAGLPSDLLTQRPDIRAAEQRLLSANANVGAARAAFFPKISLTAGVGTASDALSGLFDRGSRTWSFAPQLLEPLLFWGGRNKANMTVAEVRKDMAVADYEKSIQVAFREVADALAARATLDEQLDAQSATQAAQAARLQFAIQRFENGISSSLDVLDAQRELFTAEQQLVQTRLLRLTNSVDLYRALGGGLKGIVATK